MVDLTINGVSQSQTLDGTHDYDSVSITNGGILNVTPYNGTGTTGTLILNVSGNVYVDSASKINADLCGYSGAASSCNGLGGMPAGNGGGTAGSGGCSSSFNGGGGGGSYGTVGGNGGCSSQYYNGGCAGGGTGGIIRGTTTGQDIEMGSGAGGGGGAQTCTSCGIGVGGAGSPGGGCISITANTMNIFGTITANGGVGGWGRTVVGSSGAGSGGGGGGASGGGIKLSAISIDLTNSIIRANGGAGGGGGGGAVGGGTGGGGRIKMFGSTITITGATITAGTIYSEIVVTTGSASFTSNPSVARIWVDGVDKGVNTPNTISDLSAGSHSYTLKLTGYQDTSGSFSVIAGSTTTVPLVTFPASAYFTSTPTGATVWVDDTNLDTVTPATIVGLTAGTHAYRLIKIGYANRGSFSAVAGTTTNVSATLTAVGLNGSIWVEDQYLCYIDANNVATYIVGTNSGVVAGLVGSIWIEGTQIAYIDASNNKRLLSATAIGAVAGLSGSLWVGGSNIYHIASGIQQASDISLRYSDDVEIFVPNGWQYVKYYTLTTALRRPVTVAFEICINQDIYGGQLGTVRIKDNIYPNVNDHDYSYDVGSWKPYPAGYTRIVHEIQVNLIAGNSLYLIIGASSYGLYVKNYRIYY